MTSFSDGIGHRGRHHRNLLIVGGDTPAIIPFRGKSIPGVVTVVRHDYDKRGKWSASTWTIEPSAGVFCATISEDWETGLYIPECRWAEAIAGMRERIGECTTLPDAAIERFIRAELADEAAKLDAEAAIVAAPSALGELIAAQEELASAQREAQRFIAAAEESEEAARVKAQAASVRDALARARGGKMSLADLRATLGG